MTMIGCTSTGRSAPTSRPMCRVCAPAATTIRCASIGPRLVLTRNLRPRTRPDALDARVQRQPRPVLLGRPHERGRHQQRVGKALARAVAGAEQLRRQRRLERQHLAGRRPCASPGRPSLVVHLRPQTGQLRFRLGDHQPAFEAHARGRRPAPPPGSPTPAPRPRTAGSRHRRTPAAPRLSDAPGTGSGSARRGSGCAATRRLLPRPRGSARRAPPPARPPSAGPGSTPSRSPECRRQSRARPSKAESAMLTTRQRTGIASNQEVSSH